MTEFWVGGNSIHIMPLDQQINLLKCCAGAIRSEIVGNITLRAGFQALSCLSHRAGMLCRGQSYRRRRGEGGSGLVKIMADRLCRAEVDACGECSCRKYADSEDTDQSGRVQFQRAFPFKWPANIRQI